MAELNGTWETRLQLSSFDKVEHCKRKLQLMIDSYDWHLTSLVPCNSEPITVVCDKPGIP